MPLNNKIPAFVDNPCYICETYFSQPASLIKHMKNSHNVDLEPRIQGHKRPQSTKYVFRNVKGKQCRNMMGCPSCWFYCNYNDFERMQDHIEDIHLCEDGPDSEDPVEFDDDEDYRPINNEKKLEDNELSAAINLLSDRLKALFTK
ncbi:hypothetical protein BD770DRAFT_429643 [Pilaira anomala]|nr:hypothetical protein BD770DRAFT_429643 [Pilaira anomala]